MALFDRRTIIASLAFGLTTLLVVSATSMIYYHYRPPCSEAVAFESISPDGQWSAAMMERRCGDELPFIVHVNLRRLGEPIRVGYLSGRAEHGDVFAVERDTADPEPALEWNALRELRIQCPSCRAAQVRMREEHWGPITVRYEPLPPDNR